MNNDSTRTKTCKTCKRTFHVSSFQSSGWSKRKDGTKYKNYKSQCKECFNKQERTKYHTQMDILNIIWKCQLCGYDKCKAALDFHHIDPSQKEFAIRGISRKTIHLDKMKTEIAKCILLCARCHREVHDDIRSMCTELNLDPTLYKFIPIG